MSKLALAIKIAAEAFVNKTDKGGKPYILHCLRVMAAMPPDDEDLQIIAVLHDVVEDFKDTGISMGDIAANYGFSDRVVRGIWALTHEATQTYDEYIKLVASNSDAKKVKIADLIDNSNITRLKGLRKKDLDRIEKYHRAYTYLND